MAKRVKELKPPTGFSRLLWRAPIWIYRLKLGWLMRGRMLLLTHIGRKSGKQRQNMLEVVNYDTKNGIFVVAVGFGKKSQWYQNLKANPDAFVDGGWGTKAVTARELSPEEGGQVLMEFARRYPGEAKMAHLLGFEVDGTLEDYYDMGTQMTFMELKEKVSS